MILNLTKSLLMLQVLPQKGSISDQLIVKDLGKRISELAEDLKAKTNFAIQENGWATFDKDKDEETDFVLSEVEIHVLKRGVKALDESESVTLNLVELCKELEDMK